MQADNGVVIVRVQKLKAGASQFGAEEHSKTTTEHQHEKTGDPVLDPDYLVVIVNAKIARPGGLAMGRAMMKRGFDPAPPLIPIIHRANTGEEADATQQHPNHPGRLCGPDGVHARKNPNQGNQRNPSQCAD